MKFLAGVELPNITTAQRDALPNDRREKGMAILNTTTGQVEVNIGTGAAPIWLGWGDKPVLTVAQFNALTPVENMEVLVQAVAGDGGPLWRFKYIGAITDVYEWKAVGAQVPLASEDGNDDTVVADNAALTFTVIDTPLRGVYDFNYGAQIQSLSANDDAKLYLRNNTSGVNIDEQYFQDTEAQAQTGTVFHKPRRLTIATAGDDITVRGGVVGDAPLSATFMDKWVFMSPVRVAQN